MTQRKRRKSAPARATAAGPYRVGRWNGLPNYECAHCAFATLELSRIEAHAKQKHGIESVPDRSVGA